MGRRALHLNEAGFTRRVHALEDKFRALAGSQPKICVVFAGKFGRRGGKTVQITRKALRFGGSETHIRTLFKKHAENLIGKES